MYQIINIDWDKYLERKQAFFLFTAFIRPYGSLLKEKTGFGFINQLQTYERDTGTFYKSKKEMQAADKYYLDLVKANDPRLKIWRDKGFELNIKADQLLKEFTNNVPSINGDNFWRLYRDCEDILLYDTVIPYRILSAVNSGIEAGDPSEQYKETMELFETFRSKARYPELNTTIFKVFWQAASREAGYGDETLFSFTTPFELKAIFEKHEIPNQDELRKRQVWVAFWEDSETGIIHFNYDRNILEEIGLATVSQEITELKGNIAYPGKVQGTVCIVNEVVDMKNFYEGDILVTINSNPSLMPVLAICAGIVADEGGIMCHAAIVSRELRKPCIIGTKIATKIFKNGDVIELDADNGTVKLIKQEK